jgi:hypothetical protein
MPLSSAQLLQLAINAGFKGNDAQTMAAIVKAESSGNPNAYNPNASTGDKSYGLAQINMIGNLGPARLREFGLKTNEQLFDPQTNLNAAKKVKDSSGFGAWTTYTSGTYKQFLPEIQKTRPIGPLSEATPTTSTPTNQQTGNIYNYYFGDGSTDTAKNFLTSFLPKIQGITSKFDPISALQQAMFSTPNYFGDEDKA